MSAMTTGLLFGSFENPPRRARPAVGGREGSARAEEAQGPGAQRGQPLVLEPGIALRPVRRRHQGAPDGRVVTLPPLVFLLGLLLQGGGWIDPGGAYAYGFNLCTLRWMGILQRIAFGYGCAALIELYVPGGERTCTAPAVASADALAPETAEAPRLSHAALFVRHRWQWLLVLSLTAIQLLITYCTWVPSWRSHWDPVGSRGTTWNPRGQGPWGLISIVCST